MWNPENKPNEQANQKQKQTHKCKEQTDDGQTGGCWGVSRTGEGVTGTDFRHGMNTSQGYRISTENGVCRAVMAWGVAGE